MPKAKEAIGSAPGVLAVKVDFQSGQATVGTKAGTATPTAEIVAALKGIGYRAEVIAQPSGD